mmetsp:Transcript_42106/g.86002  ORF Transcript_42106/g.86002 Transcript_42106/m.86002 type:complete len:210 (+) Transcript_42106:2137-2766(+)
MSDEVRQDARRLQLEVLEEGREVPGDADGAGVSDGHVLDHARACVRGLDGLVPLWRLRLPARRHSREASSDECLQSGEVVSGEEGKAHAGSGVVFRVELQQRFPREMAVCGGGASEGGVAERLHVAGPELVHRMPNVRHRFHQHLAAPLVALQVLHVFVVHGVDLALRTALSQQRLHKKLRKNVEGFCEVLGDDVEVVVSAFCGGVGVG